MGPGASAVGRWTLLGPPQVSTCGVGMRGGTAYPPGAGLVPASGRSAPLPARPRAGARLSLEESRRKEHQGGRGSSSLDPPFLVWGDPAGVLSFFSAWPAAHEPTPVTARPPAGRAGTGGFADGKGPTRIEFKNSTKKRSKSVHVHGARNSPSTGTMRHTAKTSEWERAGYKTGGPGGLPPALFLPISREKWGPPPGRRCPGALRPEAPGKPRPPEGYVVPYRAPARSRAGNRVAGLDLRWSKTGPPAAPAAAVSAQLFYQRPHPAGLVPVLLGVVPEELPQAGVLGGLRPGQVGRHGRLLLAEPPAEGP